jgi:hypothetical protein
MSLSDPFKKLPIKGPLGSGQESALPEKVRKAREAALEFLSILRDGLTAADGSLQAGTLISAAGWLTGTSLYRSYRVEDDAPPGTLLKSSEINAQWESLMYLLEQFTFQRTDIPVGRLMMAGMKASESLRSEMDMSDVQKQFQEPYNAVMKKYGFDYLDGARAGIILCSILLLQYSTARIVDPYAAAGIVAERVLEAAKTVPPRLEQ